MKQSSQGSTDCPNHPRTEGSERSVNPWIKLYKEKKSSALEKAKECRIEEVIEIIRSRGAGIDECFKISKFKNKKDLVAAIGTGFLIPCHGSCRAIRKNFGPL